MRKTVKWMLFGTGGALAAAAAGSQLLRHRYDEPPYERLADEGDFEVRRYAPRVVAQTVVEGAEGDVTNEGFRRLFGYISGDNTGERGISMRTPVERGPVGTRIDMTTPVERRREREGWVITFTMPREHSLQTLPTPNDPRITLRELPGQTVAVLRFAGRADVRARQARTDELVRLTRERGYQPVGEPTLAQYDPPWVLGPLRRNEIHIRVSTPS